MNNNELIKNKIESMRKSAIDLIYSVFFNKIIKRSLKAKRKKLYELLTSGSLVGIRERAVGDLKKILIKYDDNSDDKFIIELGSFFIEYYHREGNGKHI